MRIKSGQGNVSAIDVVVSRAPKVFKLERNKIDGVLAPSVIAPMPKKVEGKLGRKVQGGGKPIPYRSRTADWGMANKKARV
jgi:hypothetical protein